MNNPIEVNGKFFAAIDVWRSDDAPTGTLKELTLLELQMWLSAKKLAAERPKVDEAMVIAAIRQTYEAHGETAPEPFWKWLSGQIDFDETELA